MRAGAVHAQEEGERKREWKRREMSGPGVAGGRFMEEVTEDGKLAGVREGGGHY